MKAVIFDMDGVIVDSQPIADKLLIDTAKKIGVTLNNEEMKYLLGVSGHDFWEYVKRTYNLPLRVEEYQSMYDEDEEINSYKYLKPIQGISELIKDLKDNQILIGLATTATKKRMEAVIDIFNMKESFNAVTSVNEVTKSKPDPEFYLVTAKKLNVDPADCIVIEDSQRGLQAAKNAKMKCVLYTKENKQYEVKPDLVITDFTMLNFKVLSLL